MCGVAASMDDAALERMVDAMAHRGIRSKILGPVGEMNEVWKIIPFANMYSVSSLGRVFSHRSRVIMKPYRKGRYLILVLTVKGKRKEVRLHRIMLETFVGPRPEGKVTRHLDGDVYNNVLKNLCYGTQKENAADTIRHGRSLVGDKNPAKRSSVKRKIQYAAKKRWLVPGNIEQLRQATKQAMWRSDVRKKYLLGLKRRGK